MSWKQNVKNNQIRVLGQRSIASSFTFGSPILNSTKGSGECDERNKRSPISLSDFLNKKLHSTPSSAGKKVVKGKLRPFSSPFGSKADDDVSGGTQRDAKEEEESKKVIDELIFEQFKCGDVDIGHEKEVIDEDERGSCSTLFGTRLFNVGGTGTSNHRDMNVGKKKWNPNEGDDHKHTTQKHSSAQGSRPALKRKGRGESLKNLRSNKRNRPSYNHYANGSGWWDSDMEGIDTEEVGFGEVWEGVGSMTYGGIDWH